jgi:hypothetical protein
LDCLLRAGVGGNTNDCHFGAGVSGGCLLSIVHGANTAANWPIEHSFELF